MRYIIISFISIFLFIGCAPKNKIIEIDMQKEKQVKEVNIKKPSLSNIDLEGSSLDTIFENKDRVFKLAIVYPSSIVKKYANDSINTAIGYLLYKKAKYNIETFDTYDQSIENLEKSFEEIAKKEFDAIISLTTISSIDTISNLPYLNSTKVFFPLIEKNDLTSFPSNFIFGAISYKDQIEKLQTFSNEKNAVIFEESYIGNKLNKIYLSSVENVEIIKSIKRTSNKFKKVVKDIALNESTLMLNTPIIKTSILLSQLRAYEIKPTLVLSTQLNYNPILVSLTQFDDRVNFILANSIEDVEDNLEDSLSVLNVDIRYNWVNYSVLVGINYLYSGNDPSIIKTQVVENQILYEPSLYNSTEYGFQKID